jgi:signal peptidase
MDVREIDHWKSNLWLKTVWNNYGFSGSMEPGFQRGDLLFLTLTDDPIRVGEIVVFKLEGRDIPIVHRVIRLHERFAVCFFFTYVYRPNGEVDILTKGDNNPVDDRGLYPPGQQWLNRKHIIGRAKGYILTSLFSYHLSFLPFVGMVTIIMNDYPQVKYALIGIMGLFVLSTRE